MQGNGILLPAFHTWSSVQHVNQLHRANAESWKLNLPKIDSKSEEKSPKRVLRFALYPLKNILFIFEHFFQLIPDLEPLTESKFPSTKLRPSLYRQTDFMIIIINFTLIMTENCCEEKFNQAVCSKVRQLIDKRESESRKTSNQRCVKQMNVSKMNTAVETKRLRSS